MTQICKAQLLQSQFSQIPGVLSDSAVNDSGKEQPRDCEVEIRDIIRIVIIQI